MTIREAAIVASISHPAATTWTHPVLGQVLRIEFDLLEPMDTNGAGRAYIWMSGSDYLLADTEAHPTDLESLEQYPEPQRFTTLTALRQFLLGGDGTHDMVERLLGAVENDPEFVGHTLDPLHFTIDRTDYWAWQHGATLMVASTDSDSLMYFTDVEDARDWVLG